MTTSTAQDAASPLSSPEIKPGAAHTPRPGSGSAVVGLQWGDEGKGKVIDLLAGSFDAVVRYNGGANAGHSVVVNGQRHAFHLMPSGVFHDGPKSIIANGVVVDPQILIEEIEQACKVTGRTIDLVVSSRAHVVMAYHKTEDERREALLSASEGNGDKSIGTTKRGIGPAYSDKANRATALRMGDLLDPNRLRDRIERIGIFKTPMLEALGAKEPVFDSKCLYDQAAQAGENLRDRITDTTYLLNDMASSGKALLFEGANATLLDVDHGTYPYVTSSNTTALGIPSGTGLPPYCVSHVTGVMKAYSTRVGAGPMPTELDDETGSLIRERGSEYGTTTGRPRRCGWIDLVALRYAVMLNGCSSLALTLLDVLAGFDAIKVCTSYRLEGGSTTDRFLPDADALEAVAPVYESLPGFDVEITSARVWNDLPENAQRYVEFLEEKLGVPIEIVGVGPDREQTIRR